MKKLLISLLAVMLIISIVPAFTFAAGHGDDRDRDHNQGHNQAVQHHDQAWRHQHDQMWKAHQKEWSDHDREWMVHRNDRRWREEHIRMWSDWYQWHRDNESILNIRVSVDSHGGPRLDIDFRR